MNKVQLHPTGFIDPKKPTDGTKFLAAEALRGAGGIMVNQKGVRFANELGRRDEVTKLIIENCEIDEKAKAHIAYLIMNDKTIDRFGWPAFNFYWKIKGFFTVRNDCIGQGIVKAIEGFSSSHFLAIVCL